MSEFDDIFQEAGREYSRTLVAVANVLDRLELSNPTKDYSAAFVAGLAREGYLIEPMEERAG